MLRYWQTSLHPWNKCLLQHTACVLLCLSDSPLEEQNSNDYDDDEDDSQHWTHHPQHLWVLGLPGHSTVGLHNDGLRERAGRERPLLRVTRGRSRISSQSLSYNEHHQTEIRCDDPKLCPVWNHQVTTETRKKSQCQSVFSRRMDKW